jgi:hypothetical protein
MNPRQFLLLLLTGLILISAIEVKYHIKRIIKIQKH